MIKIRRNCKKNRKKEVRNQKKLKSKEKALVAKFRSQKGVIATIAFYYEKISQPSGVATKILLPSAKIDLRCEIVSQPPCARCESPP